MDINIRDDIVKTNEEKTAATKNIEMMYQATEYPVINYISQITGISKNDILNEDEILPQGGFPINLNEKKYMLGIEVVETGNYTYEFPEEIHSGDISYQNNIKQIFNHLGMLIWFIKNMTLNMLLGNPKLSNLIKDLFKGDKIEYDETSNTLYIKYDTHKHNNQINISEHEKYRLGIVFTDTTI